MAIEKCKPNCKDCENYRLEMAQLSSPSPLGEELSEKEKDFASALSLAGEEEKCGHRTINVRKDRTSYCSTCLEELGVYGSKPSRPAEELTLEQLDKEIDDALATEPTPPEAWVERYWETIRNNSSTLPTSIFGREEKIIGTAETFEALQAFIFQEKKLSFQQGKKEGVEEAIREIRERKPTCEDDVVSILESRIKELKEK